MAYTSHLITNQFIDVNRGWRAVQRRQIGARIHVTPMPSEHSGILGEVFVEGAAGMPIPLAAVGRIRQRLEWTRVKDIVRETLFSRVYQACKEWKGWVGRGQFVERMDLVRRMVILTIENGWNRRARIWWYSVS